MKKVTKKLLSLMLCLMVALGMCAEFTATASAATLTTVKEGATIAVKDINSSDSDSIVYKTESFTHRTTPLTYNLKLPASGGTVFTLVPEDYAYGVKVNGNYSADSTKIDSNTMRAFHVSGSTAKLEFSLDYDTTTVGFGVWFAPSSKAVSANGTEYVLGASSSTSITTFKVTVPSKGYIDVTACGGIDTPYSAYIKTAGFKDWEYLGSSDNYTTRIGVKKGTYTISMKSNYNPVRNVKVKFHKVTETSSKTTKKKAAKIKKKKLNKGIIVTNNKKVHWYKIKNPKNQKMRLTVNASKIGYGSGSTGKLKITVYFPDKKTQYATLYAGNTGKYNIKYGTIGTNKARKGTYYVKVQSQGGANGYYTLKWW